MKISIKDKILDCEVKSTSEGLKSGMQNRGRLEGCMVFILPYRGEQSFWMKDCLISLDIVFCDNNKVTAIHPNCEPCEEEPCATYGGYGNMALEFKAGFCNSISLQIGDEISFRD